MLRKISFALASGQHFDCLARLRCQQWPFFCIMDRKFPPALLVR